MVSYTTYFLVKCLTTWNTVYDWCGSVKKSLSDFSCYVLNYFRDHHNTWYLLKGYSLPICAQSVTDTTCPFFRYDWTYSSTTNVLTHCENTNEQYKIGWLSADIVIKKGTYEVHYSMDDFLQTLTIYMKSTHILPIHDLFQTWCIHQRRWFHPQHDPIEIHAFDSYGEMQQFSLNDTHSLYLKAEGKKLVVPLSENKN